MQENNCLKLPQMSNSHWCWKNEQHLKCKLEFWPPDVSKLKAILVFQQLLTLFKMCFHSWCTKITSYLDISCLQKSKMYFNVIYIFTTIRHLWKLKIVIFEHRCLIHAVLFNCSILTPVPILGCHNVCREMS